MISFNDFYYLIDYLFSRDDYLRETRNVERYVGLSNKLINAAHTAMDLCVLDNVYRFFV